MSPTDSQIQTTWTSRTALDRVEVAKFAAEPWKVSVVASDDDYSPSEARGLARRILDAATHADRHNADAVPTELDRPAHREPCSVHDWCQGHDCTVAPDFHSGPLLDVPLSKGSVLRLWGAETAGTMRFEILLQHTQGDALEIGGPADAVQHLDEFRRAIDALEARARDFEATR